MNVFGVKDMIRSLLLTGLLVSVIDINGFSLHFQQQQQQESILFWLLQDVISIS